MKLLASYFLLTLVSVVCGKSNYRLRQSLSNVQRPSSTTSLTMKEKSVRKLCGKSGKSGKAGNGKAGKNGRRRSLEEACDDDYYFGDDGMKTFPPMGKGKGGSDTSEEVIPPNVESSADDDLIEPVAPLTGEDPIATIAPGVSSDDENSPTEDDVALPDDVLPAEDDATRTDDVVPEVQDDDVGGSLGPGTDDGSLADDDGANDDIDLADDDISISNEDIDISGFPDDDFSISNEELVQTDDEVSNDP